MLKTVAHLTLPFALLDDGTYKVSLDNEEATIVLKRENTVSRQAQLMGGQFIVPQGATMKMENDFYGLVDITRIRIELPFLIRSTHVREIEGGKLEDVSHDNHNNVQKICINYLNRLIEVIRWQTRRFWIYNLAGTDAYLNKFDLFDHDGRNIGGQVQMQPILTLSKLPSNAVNQSNKKNQIESSLASNERIPVHDTLYLDALQDFSQGKFNKSVMIISTGLESAITEYLLQQLIKNGMSKENAKKKIDQFLKFGKKRNGKTGFGKILSEDFKEVTGRSLEDVPELWEGFKDARLKRKTTIHPYVGKLSEEIARNTINTILNVINWALEEERYPVIKNTASPIKKDFVVDSVIKENGNIIGFSMWAWYGDIKFRNMRFVHKHEELNLFRTQARDLFLIISPSKNEKIQIISADRNESLKLEKLSPEGQKILEELPEYVPESHDCPNDEWLAKNKQK